MTQEALKLALEALHGFIPYLPLDDETQCGRYDKAITAIKEALAQPEQEPVAFPRQAGESTWTVDTAFIWRVKHTIDPDTPNDFTPSEEQIETVLLALEKIPSKLYVTPPQRTWVGLTEDDRVLIKHDANFNQFMTAGEYADRVQQLTEARLKDLNT